MMLRKSTLLAVLPMLAAGAAAAADLPSRYAPPPMPYYAASIYTWTGFYAGVNVGGAFDNETGSLVPHGFAPGVVSTVSNGSNSGFTGGGQIGYNYQMGRIVFGGEADVSYVGLGGHNSATSTSTYFGPGTSFTANTSDGDGFLGTVRGRLGFAPTDRALLYVTGGLAYGDYGARYTSAEFQNGNSFASFTSDTDDNVRVGYALGAGLEFAITPNLTAKAEYLYADIGRNNYTLTNINNPGVSFTAHSDGTAQIARVGLNYKFTTN